MPHTMHGSSEEMKWKVEIRNAGSKPIIEMRMGTNVKYLPDYSKMVQ